MPQVRVSLAGLGELQEADQDVGAGVHRAPDELGPEQHRRRADVSQPDW